MFLSRQAYQDLKDEVVKARAEADAQRKANIVLEANMDWFRHRLTQIEKERAVLLHNTLGIKVPAPEFHKDDPVKRFMLDHPLSEMDIFRDLSEEEAREQGIVLNDEGVLAR